MPGTIWEWLGIDATTDKKLIRKAYAEQAKKYHPEEFPGEAQELRKAYKRAMELASSEERGGFSVREDSRGDDLKQDSGYVYVPKQEGEERERRDSREGKGEDNSKQDSGYVYVSKQEKEEGKRRDRQEDSREDDSRKGSGYIYASKSEGQGKKTEEPAGESRETSNYQYGVYMDSLGSGHDREEKFIYQYFNGRLEPAKQERVLKFLEQIVFVSNDSECCICPAIWQMVFRKYPQKEDFRDPLVVEEVLFVIEQLHSIERSVWKVIKARLFKYFGDSIEWVALRERLEKLGNTKEMSRKYDALFVIHERIAESLYGENSRTYKWYRFWRCFLKVLLIISLVLLVSYVLIFTNMLFPMGVAVILMVLCVKGDFYGHVIYSGGRSIDIFCAVHERPDKGADRGKKDHE